MTEKLKENSNYLRGTLIEDIKNQITGSVTKDNHELIKFHGIYEQDDRDRRTIRAKKKLEKDYSFMIRFRIAAGKISSKQWIGINKIAQDNSTGIIKITTRQTIQLHGVIKSKLKPTIKYFNKYNLDSIAACGDVNRNVMATVFGNNKELCDYAVKISNEFLPKTNAYNEIWLDGEKVTKDEEPLYGKTYLPRKFKIVLALPPYNDVDVYAHDIGLIAIQNKGKIEGFNIVAGGGMGRTYGNEKTYPKIGDLIGYVSADRMLEIVKNIILFQRDNGCRNDRKQARLKYTIDNFGLKNFIDDLERRAGFKLEKTKDFKFTHRADIMGWLDDKKYCIFIENGRILSKMNDALSKIAEKNIGNFNFTNNQNVIITDISNKSEFENILKKYNIKNPISKIEKNAIACVALNTCPLAFAEGQRYLPSLLKKIDLLLGKYNLLDEEIYIRMTGCPNGCARPYLAEIAFIGKSSGKYDIYLGASKYGDRLNKLYKESLNELEILKELDILFFKFIKCKNVNESFGDFVNLNILK